MNVQDFNRALQEWPDKVAMQQATEMQRQVLTDLASGLVDATPVAPARYRNAGHAKRQWRIDLFRASESGERPGADPTGVIAKQEATAVIASIREKPVPFATVSNPIEWSKPQGWFDQVVARVSAKYARVR